MTRRGGWNGLRAGARTRGAMRANFNPPLFSGVKIRPGARLRLGSVAVACRAGCAVLEILIGAVGRRSR